MRVLSAYHRSRPPGVCTPVTHRHIGVERDGRKVVMSPCGAARPVSSANGTTVAASMLPQLGVVSTVSPSGLQLQKQELEVMPGRLLPLTIP